MKRPRSPSRAALTSAALAILLALAPAAARAEVEVGADAPDFSAEEYLNTEPVALADLSGRLVLLELWKTT